MQCPVNSIVVKDRVRHDAGDLTSLMESMRDHGQLSPLVVTRGFELVAGFRRLESARRLGWQVIEVTIVDRDSPVDKLEMELEENVLRKDFSPEELLAGYARLERLRRPTVGMRIGNFFRRIGKWFGGLFKRKSGKAAGESEPVGSAWDDDEFGPI